MNSFKEIRMLYVDLDGTVRKPKDPDHEFIQGTFDQVIIPEAGKALKYLSEEGWHIYGITNQLGVQLEYKSLLDCVKEQEYTAHMLTVDEEVRNYAGTLFCPDEGDTCVRVDNVGMLAGFHVWHNYIHKRKDFVYKRKHWGIEFSNFRKPDAGMIQLARLLTPKEIIHEVLIGDMESDKQCAANAGISFIWANEWHDLQKMLDDTNQQLDEISNSIE